MADVNSQAGGRRERRALETRRRIRAAAQELFERQGYVATTIQQIAEHADVAWQTVYAVFGTKAALLAEIFDVTVAGDDKPIPMVERQFVRDIANASDPREKARLFAEHLCESNMRTAAVQNVIETVAATDSDIAALWTKLMLQLTVGMTRAAQSFKDQGVLRSDITVATAADLLWWYAGPWSYRALVLNKGWSPAQFKQWLSDALYGQLMRSP